VRSALATRPGAFHLGTLGLALEPIASTLAAEIESADDETLVMVDPNCRPSVIADRAAYVARLDGVFARADVVKLSGDDLAYLVPGVDPREAARTLLGRGPSVVLLTDGGRGVVATTRTATLDIEVPAVHVVDTVGAGDAFGGGFLARWVERGLGRADLADPAAIADAVTLAIEVAGITCQRAGADPPRRAELGRDWPTSRSTR
jgi:fructokinase